MFLSLCLRYSVYFILCAVALLVLFLVRALVSPGSKKIGDEIATSLPAAYLLGRAYRTAPPLMAAFIIATLTMVLFAGQIAADHAAGGY